MEKEDGESAADWTQASGTGATASVYDDRTGARRSKVIHLQDADGSWSWMRVGGSWNETRRVISFWAKQNTVWDVGVGVTTSAGNRTIVLRGQAGTDAWIPAWNQYRVYLGSSVADGDNLNGDRKLYRQKVLDYIVSTRYPHRREKRVVRGGSIGHIAWDVEAEKRRRLRNPPPQRLRRGRSNHQPVHLRRDGGFHYDQVGSVMSASNNSGNLETRIDQDAFGNVLSNWQSGQWASDTASAGWHHNTKELDGDIGLV